MKVNEITFDKFVYRNLISSCSVFGKFSPAIFKRENGYGIRIKTGSGIRGMNYNVAYDYFTLDETGLIIMSPRGMAKKFNKRVRIIDIDKILEIYKEWRINE
jgi:hypothetical protein